MKYEVVSWRIWIVKQQFEHQTVTVTAPVSSLAAFLFLLSSEVRESLLEVRVARFFLDQTYQNGKNIPNDHKLTKLP
jgi:hypothetical protein